MSANDSPVVFIAGQYGSGPDGLVTDHDFDAQAELAFTNLGRALAAAELDFDHVVRIGTYIVDHGPAKLATVGRLVHRHWGDRAPAQTLIGVAGLAMPDMLFEVDAVAVRT